MEKLGQDRELGSSDTVKEFGGSYMNVPKNEHENTKKQRDLRECDSKHPSAQEQHHTGDHHSQELLCVVYPL